MRRFQSKKKTPLPGDESLLIERFSHDGRGIAKSHGKVVMVSGALPGETCHVRYHQANSKMRQATALSIKNPAPERSEPICSLYGQCGGCQQQHIAHATQLTLKQRTITEQLQRNGVPTPELEAPIVSTSFAYRHRARFHVSKNGQIGFHGLSSNKLIEVRECPIFTPPLQQAFEQLRAEVSLVGVRELELVVDDFAQTGLNIMAANAQASARLQTWAHAKGWLLSEPLSYLAGREKVFAKPGAFTQVNRDVNQQMQARLSQWGQFTASDRLLDLFCGNGNLSIGIADQVAAVLGLESSKEAIEQALSVAPKNALYQVKNLFTEDLHALPEVVEFDPTIAVIDPPRAGAQRLCQTISALPKLTKILYISCDPATLARDLHSLGRDKWHLRKVALVDMFPQTRHIETMVLLEK